MNFDNIAAELVAMAFSDVTAREQIAQRLRLIWLEGQYDGLQEARRVVNETFADQSLT
jgi:hypothetical protein